MAKERERGPWSPHTPNDVDVQHRPGEQAERGQGAGGMQDSTRITHGTGTSC
jgi:hypothetical protein